MRHVVSNLILTEADFEEFGGLDLKSLESSIKIDKSILKMEGFGTTAGDKAKKKPKK